jgi:hypothetical protein
LSLFPLSIECPNLLDIINKPERGFGPKPEIGIL